MSKSTLLLLSGLVVAVVVLFAQLLKRRDEDGDSNFDGIKILGELFLRLAPSIVLLLIILAVAVWLAANYAGF